MSKWWIASPLSAIVPDSQMGDGEVGQGATIMTPSSSGWSAPAQPAHRGRHHQNEAAPQPDCEGRSNTPARHLGIKA